MAGEAADESLNNLISGVDGLGIAGGSDGPQLPQTLITAIKELEQTVEYLNEQAANIKTLLSSSGELEDGNTATVSQIYQQANNIGRVSLWLNDAAVQSIVTHITSLDNRRYSDTPKLLKHFDDSIKTITRRFLSQGNVDYAHTLWRIVEECCIQAVPSGKLDPDGYLASITEPERPWHPNQDLGVIERCIDGNKKTAKEEWTRFWTECLNECPGGPTLFIPPKHFSPFDSPPPPAADPPRYLFRAYDSGSWGSNGEEIFTSGRHENYGSTHSEQDVFAMDRQNASTMLHRHLNGPHRSNGADNLVSWSSSLLFVIQYANFRCWNYAGQDATNVSICAVDTTKFPKGQFASAKWLRERYTGTRLEEAELDFLRMRSNNPDYDNGEYLSQGTLHVRGRSGTTSLQSLQSAGLGLLYKGLDINRESNDLVRTEWTRYVRGLRKEWRTPCETSKNEIDVARIIARQCFGFFDEMDISLFLLAFRSRISSGRVLIPKGEPMVMYEEDPEEVQRYGYWKRRQKTKALGSAACLAELFELRPDGDSF